MFLYSHGRDRGISYPSSLYHRLHYFPLTCLYLSPALSSCNTALLLLTFHLLSSPYSSVPSEIERGSAERAESFSHSISGWNWSTDHWKSSVRFCALWGQVNSFSISTAVTRQVMRQEYEWKPADIKDSMIYEHCITFYLCPTIL